MADAPSQHAHEHGHSGDACCDDHCDGEHAHKDGDEHRGHHEHEHAPDGGTHHLAAAAPASSEEEAEDAPLPPISWKIVSIIYACGSVLCAVFGVLHYNGVQQVKGFYLTFALFPVCLLYALFKWRAQRAAALETASAAKKND